MDQFKRILEKEQENFMKWIEHLGKNAATTTEKLQADGKIFEAFEHAPKKIRRSHP